MKSARRTPEMTTAELVYSDGTSTKNLTLSRPGTTAPELRAWDVRTSF